MASNGHTLRYIGLRVATSNLEHVTDRRLKQDMTSYLSLLKTDQKIIFDLGNLIDSTYTAAFNVTVTAAYFEAEDSVSPADVILPISSRQSSNNAPSVFTVPSDIASNSLSLPRNIQKAVFTVAATGQSQEEVRVIHCFGFPGHRWYLDGWTP